MRKVFTASLFLTLAASGLACSNSGSSGNTASSNNIVNRAIAAFLPAPAQPVNAQPSATSRLNGTQQSPIYSNVGATYGNQ